MKIEVQIVFDIVKVLNRNNFKDEREYMRILVLNHNDQDKGTFFRCFFLSKCLCQYNNEVVLSCLNPNHNTLRTKIIQIDDVQVYLLAGQHGASSLFELPYHILRALINIRLAVFGKFDVVYSFNVASLTTGVPVIILKLFKILKIFRARLIVDWDDWWGMGGLTSIENKGKFLENVVAFLETKIPLLADKVTVASDMLKDRALQVGIKPNDIFYLPNGANIGPWCELDIGTLRRELQLPFDKNILCYVGRDLTTFDYLMESISLVVKKWPNIVVLLIAPLGDLHMEIIKNQSLSENVISLGEQPYEKVLLYLRASEVLLMPRANNMSDRANSPLRLRDYMSVGRPIVATSIGEAEAVIRENQCGLLAKPNDPLDFAVKVLELLNDPRLGEDMGRRGLEVAKHKLSWQIVAGQLMWEVLSNGE